MSHPRLWVSGGAWIPTYGIGAGSFILYPLGSPRLPMSTQNCLKLSEKEEGSEKKQWATGIVRRHREQPNPGSSPKYPWDLGKFFCPEVSVSPSVSWSSHPWEHPGASPSWSVNKRILHQNSEKSSQDYIKSKELYEKCCVWAFSYGGRRFMAPISFLKRTHQGSTIQQHCQCRLSAANTPEAGHSCDHGVRVQHLAVKKKKSQILDFISLSSNT